MRNRFIQLLCAWAKEDESIYLLTADLGFSVLEPFAQAFPSRFINVGIAEQNMIGIAVGLSLMAKRVFVYSIVNFGTIRCLEQIRNDVCYHNANVIVVIVGAGLAYGLNGYTHLGVEDLAVMLPMPKMKVLSPADNFELEACMGYIKKNSGPSYLRLSKGGEPLIHSDYFDIEASFKSELFSDINIICHGTVLSEAIKTKLLLKENYNLNIGVFSIPLLKPFPTNNCLDLLRHSRHIFLIEEHMQYGGMNSLVTSLAASLGPDCPYIYAYALDEKVMHVVGDQTYLRSSFGLNAENLLESILSDLSIIAKLEV
ncbi:transketolase family protein [Rickettsiella endosymbiont of Miltochrista miniata]|uniref:transketolase family protein n=1 Tax=Rickettsiella endosymbiont of Miltochrista miniata TaxID=3066239 RepID=UPI00313E7B6C